MSIETVQPVTIRIDPTIHNAMRTMARQQRVHISLLYERAAESFLNEKNNTKKDAKKTTTLPVTIR